METPMRQIMAIIAAVMARMATATKWVIRTGKWVLEQVPLRGDSVPVPAMPQLDASASAADEVAPIKRVAGVLAQGHVPQAADLEGLSHRHLAWLKELDRMQLCRVLAAKPDEIRGHLLGRQLLRAVSGADAETVKQLRQARASADLQRQVSPDARSRRADVERAILELETGSPVPAM